MQKGYLPPVMTQHMPAERTSNFYLSQHCVFDSLFKEQTRFALEKGEEVYDPRDGEKPHTSVPSARRRVWGGVLLQRAIRTGAGTDFDLW